MVSTGHTLGMAGSYNTNSLPQLAAVHLSTPYIRQAIDVLDVFSSPLVIADFGCSHGLNSLHAMKLIIHELREAKKDGGREMLVVHNDLPTNDWSSLFDILIKDGTYHGLASGRSFYEQCLPSNTLSIGYSSSSIHWLSRKPCNLTNHCLSLFARGDELESFKQQAHLDYARFLEYRSSELRTGGVLILIIVCVDEYGSSGCDSSRQLLADCGRILLTPAEQLDYTIPGYLRSYEECIDRPLFTKCNLELIQSDFVKVNNPLGMQWRTGEITLDEFARAVTQQTKSWSESALRQGLEDNGRSSEEVEKVLGAFWTKYEEYVRTRPHEHDDCIFYTRLLLKKL